MKLFFACQVFSTSSGAPLPFVMQDDLVDRAMDPQRLGDRVLLNQTLGHTKQNVNDWIKRLKPTMGDAKHNVACNWSSP